MWRDKQILFSISDVEVFSYVQQVRDIQSFIGQEFHSSMKTIRVDIYKELTSSSIEEG